MRDRLAFEDAVRRKAPAEARKLLEDSPGLLFDDPAREAQVDALQYELLRPRAEATERLARAGKLEEAREAWSDIYRESGRPLLVDFARAADRRARALIDRGRFAEAWRESWMLRAADIILTEEFLQLYAAERWRREGFEMSREELRGFLEEVGEADGALRPRSIVILRKALSCADAAAMTKQWWRLLVEAAGRGAVTHDPERHELCALIESWMHTGEHRIKLSTLGKNDVLGDVSIVEIELLSAGRRTEDRSRFGHYD